MKRRRKKLGLSTTKWSNADYECGCGRCCPMRQTPDAKLMDRRIVRRRGAPLDDGYGPPEPEPGFCDCEDCAPTYELLEAVDRSCRWDLPRKS